MYTGQPVIGCPALVFGFTEITCGIRGYVKIQR